MLTRSASGIANYNIFVHADVVVYVEGGNIEKKSDLSASDDIHYWNIIVKHFIPHCVIKFKPLGSKLCVVEMALKIIKSGIANSICILDKDHDGFKNIMIDDPRVFYTYGYSWENDLVQEHIFKIALAFALRTNALTASIDDEVSRYFSGFKRRMHGIVKLDAIYSCVGVSVIKKNRFGGGLLFLQDGIPVIDINCYKKSIVDAKRRKSIKTFIVHRKFSIETLLCCYGHFLFSYMINAFKSIVKRENGKVLSNEHVFDLFIMGLKESIRNYSELDVYRYYNSMFRSYFFFRFLCVLNVLCAK